VISPRVKGLLDGERVAYEVVPHPEAFTAQGVAASMHVSGWSMAKVVLLRDDDGSYVEAIIPASRHLDLRRLRRIAGRPGLELASEEEMTELFPDCVAGAIPPFGGLYGVQVYVDTCFPHAREVVFHAGNHREAVRMDYSAFESLVRPVVGEFCSH